jgi:hypothetical protein
MPIRAAFLAMSVAVLGLPVNPAQARLVGQILQIGFPASGGVDFGGGGEVYRHGKWLPVAVELRLEGQAQFTGFVRIEQDDKDGDRNVCQAPVTLVAEGGVARTFWLYAMANPQQQNPARAFSVQVIDERGNGVPLHTPTGNPGLTVDRLIPAQPMAEVATENTIILDISEVPLNRLDRAMLASDRALKHPLIVTRTTPRLVPDLWQGLEMVDFIFWDDPNPEALNRSQTLALIQWIQHGGTLVLGVGRTAEAISRSALGDYLPVDIAGQRLTDQLPTLRYYFFLKEPDDLVRYESPLNVCQAKAKPGAFVEVHEKSIDSDLIVRGKVGAGGVIFIGGPLRDVLNVPSDRLAPFVKLLTLRYDFQEEADANQGNRFAYSVTRHLFVGLHDFINFNQSAGLYLLAAIAFVVVYILVSTLGSWQWLRRQSRLHHAWTAFTICAILASGVSIAAVQWAQGFGRDLHQLTIVTGQADTLEAGAYVQFGYKTSNFTNVDLWLPSGEVDADGPLLAGCHLRPLPPDPEFGGQTFVAPQQYRLRPGLGVVENLPMRATLKQLEGQWLGKIPGMVTGKILLRGPTWNLAVDNASYIENQLGVDLEYCHLIQARYGVADLESVKAMSREKDILVHPLGKLNQGDRLNKLGDRLYLMPDGKTKRIAPEMNKRSLGVLQKEWSRLFGMAGTWGARTAEQQQALSLEDQDKILLLLTTCEEFPNRIDDRQTMQSVVFERSYVRHLDLSREIGPERMLFIGFSDGPPPFHLRSRTHSQTRENDWEIVKPEKSRTMYRIWIPVTQE